MLRQTTWLVALPLASALAAPSVKQSNCESFVRSFDISPYNGQIQNATYHQANTVNITNTFNTLPFCEVNAKIFYGQRHHNNTLNFALWLPDTAHWSSRFMAVGNGGMAGTIDTLNMITQLNSGMGFTVSGGDAGHLASDNNDGGGAPGVYLPYLHDPEQVEAWIHNAISLFTPAAKAMTEAFYTKDIAYSYYDGCSTGGAQGFALAQFHPELFDGVFAGSPGNWYSRLALSFLWNAQHTNTSAANLTQAILNFTTNAVLDACDALDGVADRLIENPLQCNFSISSLACPTAAPPSPTDADAPITCLTYSQLTSMEAIYAGPVRSDTAKQLYPGFSPGSEIEWILQEGTLADAFSIPILQNLVYDDLDYDSNTFNWASDVRDVHVKAGNYIDAIKPDLNAFHACGGKMLVAQGWADPFNAALWPIEHLKQIEDAFGGDVGEWFRLFMVPGGGHCGAASFYPDVPAVYETVQALVEWVEEGRAPEAIKSADPPDGSGRTRRLCAWPGTARYVGGDVEDWGSYVCQ